MSIDEEDFPKVIMLSNSSQEMDAEDKFSNLTTGAINTSISEKSSSSLMGNEEHSTSSINGQSSSGVSSHDKSSCLSSNDKFGQGHGSQDLINSKTSVQSNNKMNKFYRQNSLSYQDLHSNYTKKKYKHVKSKVREYIAHIKQQDRHRQSKKLERQYSLAESFVQQNSLENAIEIQLEHNCNEANGQNFSGDPNLNAMLIEKERKISELKMMNEYLQTNLEEKRAQMARLERNSNATRIELMQIKENEKRLLAKNYSLTWKRYSPRKTFGMENASNQNKMSSIGVQVNFIGSDSFLESPKKVLDNSNLLVIQPIPLDFNFDSSHPNDKSQSIRRRSNSNTILSVNDTKSDLFNNNNNYETETENSTDQLDTFDNMANKSTTSIAEFVPLGNKKQNKRYKFLKRQKWIWMMMGPCNNCVQRKRKTSDSSNYTSIPMFETLSDSQLE